MGGKGSKPKGASTEDKVKNDMVDTKLWKAQRNDSEVIKLLLLGAGESGKSTLFKQMTKLFGEGFSEKDLMMYIPMVYNNVLESSKELCNQLRVLGDEYPECKLSSDEAIAARDFINNEVKVEDRLTPDIAEKIKAVWADEAAKHTYGLRSKFQMMDSASYYFDNVTRVASEEYIPSEEDIIRCRVRTTGIVESKFVIDDNRFLIVDVGGQRNERKKWIHCFDSVTAVIYVVALSEYDQVLYEDGRTNRMDEALKLFEDTCQLKWFADMSILLFLNKSDLFTQKISRTPLSVWRSDVAADGYDESLAYIQGEFESRVKQSLYVHVTCATDSNNIRTVFETCKDIIIQKHLMESGLM